MKLGAPTRIQREAMTDLPKGEWPDILLKSINQSNEQFTQALQNNVTLSDNLNAAVITQRLTHGVEVSIANPLKTRPVGMHAVRSSAISGGIRYTVQSLDWRFIDSADAKSAQQLGITARYAPPFGQLSVQRAAAFSVPYNALTAVVWDTTVYQGGGLSVSSATITAAVAGVVNVQYGGIFDDADGGRRVLVVSFGVGAIAPSTSRTGDGGFAASGSNDIVVSAGDTFNLSAYQNRTAASALDLTAIYTLLQARYVSPPIAAKNDVTIVVYGG